MSSGDCNELAYIVKQMENGDQPGVKSTLPVYKTAPFRMMENLSSPNYESIKQTINWLSEDSSRKSVEYLDYQPYIHIVLSFAHCKLDNNEQSLEHAQIAIEQFHRSPDQWDRVMAHWFLGIVYRMNELTEEAKIEFEKALILLEEYSVTASRKYNHKTLRLCYGHIAKIKDTIKKLHNRKAHPQSTNKPEVSHDAFSKIIERFIIPQDELHLEWLDVIRSMNPSDLSYINSQIEILTRAIETQENSELIFAPIANIFLAHCYNLSYMAGDYKSVSNALKYAEDSLIGFQSQMDKYNQVVSRFYLALIYLNTSDNQISLTHLNESDRLLERLSEEYQDNDFYEEIQNLQSEVQFWINSINLQDTPVPKPHQKHKAEKTEGEKKSLLDRLKPGNSRKHPSLGLTFTQFRKNETTTRQMQLLSQDQRKKGPGQNEPPKGKERPLSNKKGESLIGHIIIPVDLRALEDKNPILHTLDHDKLEQLYQYDEIIFPGNGQNASRSTPRTTQIKQVTIPRIPLYGQVAAGPNGEPSLDSPVGMVEAIKDDVHIHIEGQKFEAAFIHNEQFNFKNEGCYGWLKVVGQSMNKSDPIAVNDGDYVLFSENRIASQCAHKIVVAGLPETDYDFLLVVKRLLRNESSPHERPEYVLHSESSLDKDPRTSGSYKQDIKISDDNQLVGEVIAIAKPI